MSEILWKDRKRTIFGLPLSFTKYRLTEEKIIIETGFFNKTEEEIRLYRIMDLTLKRSFGQRIFGLGTIHCCSGDKSTPEFEIIRIKNSQNVKDLISEYIEINRRKNRISSREILHDLASHSDFDDDDNHDDDDDNDHH